MMKKHILSLLAMLVLLSLSACFPGPEYDPDPEPQEPVEGPPPEKYTVYLVGDDTIGISIGGGDYNKQQPARDGTSRALTNDMAQAFHDFFEVVFYYNGAAPVGQRIARTTWDVGETPELRGVYGKGDSTAEATGIGYSNVRQPAAGAGSAVLFVGSKADKTLLAIGRLAEVDNGTGSLPGNTIRPNTVSVTFEVTAITAGAGFNHATSSFRTDNATGATTFYNYPASSTDTGIFIHYVDKDKKRFPCYRLRHGATTNGEYTFSLFSGNFSDYVGTNGAIVLAGGWNCEVRQPRYFLADGYYQTSSIFPQAIKQGAIELINMSNNKQTRDYINAGFTNIAYFVNPVTFAFDTTNSPDGSIFALTFEIMVYNLTPRPTTMAGSTDAEPVKWRLSTGTGTKWLDLDDGKGGEGGAILLGSSTGNILTDRLDAYNWQ
jgi:predicted small lipoprotein YifL